MPAQLLALTEGPNIVVDKPILLLGRHPECDILIDSRKISRRHCVVAQVSDYLVVRDLESTNGIRINGHRVQEGKLHAGDELTVGNHRYQVTWDDRPLPPPPQERRRDDYARVYPPGHRLDDDEALEECDEPVPLPELPPRGAAPVVGKPARPPDEAPKPSPLLPSEPMILPDDFPLVPRSDPGKAKQGSGSHHP